MRTWLARAADASACARSRATDSSRARRMRRADSLFCSWLFSFWQDTTSPLGRWVIRTAESVVFTLCPPGPEERYTSIRRSLGSMSTSTSAASGSTKTPAAEVWMRPADSVTGTRCTRWTPPSKRSRPKTPSEAPRPAFTATLTSR